MAEWRITGRKRSQKKNLNAHALDSAALVERFAAAECLGDVAANGRAGVLPQFRAGRRLVGCTVLRDS